MGAGFTYHCEYFDKLILMQIKIVDFIQLILAVIVHLYCSALQIPDTLFIFVSTVILCSDLETVWLMLLLCI